MPVLPEVASISVSPGRISPRSCARLIMDSAGRSLTDPAGLLPSSLPSTTVPRAPLSLAPMRCSTTSGVWPTASSIVGYFIRPTVPYSAALRVTARVAKLVDALDSKSSSERSAGSIPAPGTTPMFVIVEPPHNRREIKGLRALGVFWSACLADVCTPLSPKFPPADPQMATPKKTAAGCWNVQIEVGCVRESGTFDTRREALAWAQRHPAQLRQARHAAPGNTKTLRDALRDYAQKVSPTKLTLLGHVLEIARHDWGWIPVNPMKDVTRPAAPDHRAVLIAGPQVRRMLRQLGWRGAGQPVRSVSEAMAVCMSAALLTGMRAGELCALARRDLHEDHAVLHTSKTGKGRHVPLTATRAAAPWTFPGGPRTWGGWAGAGWRGRLWPAPRCAR